MQERKTFKQAVQKENKNNQCPLTFVVYWRSLLSLVRDSTAKTLQMKKQLILLKGGSF